jgi:hypothetical protein
MANMDKFAALVPSEDTLESATKLRISIMDKFKDLGAIIYDSECNEITAIFNNTIRISIYTNGVNENYWILKIDVCYCPLSLIKRFCPPLEYPRLNLHKEITVKFYQFCMMGLNRVFNLDIANNILSFIDFKHLFIPLSSDRCARISPELLVNIMIVLSEQDVKNEALNAVMCELVPLTDSCSTVKKDGSGYSSSSLSSYGGILCRPIFINEYIPIYPVMNITVCSFYNVNFDKNDRQLSVWGPYAATATRVKHRHMYKQLHKIWHRYSFYLGLIYKLVRENKLVISQRANTLQLVRANTLQLVRANALQLVRAKL